MKHEFYKKLIADAVDSCADLDLLDLVWKLLLDGQEKTADEKVVYLFQELEVAA